jgi:hypothetical protein
MIPNPYNDGEQPISAMRRPYGAEQTLDKMPPLGSGAPPGAAALQRLDQLPPEMRAAVVSVLGSDPMVASALLAVLGDEFAKLVQRSMAEYAQMQAESMPPAGPSGASGGAAAIQAPRGV